MRKTHLRLVATFFLLLTLFAVLPPQTAAFQYIHYWRINFTGFLEVSGNQSLPILPYWNYIGNQSWQTCEHLHFDMTHNNETIEPIEIITDLDGNPQLVLNITTPLEPNDTLTWHDEWLITVSNQRPRLPQIYIDQSGDVEEIGELMEPEDYDRYTRGTTLWKTWNQSLVNISQDIRNSLPLEVHNNTLALVHAAIRWIQNNIQQSVGLSEPQYPEETIVSKIGDCDDQSNLLITFLRIFNIPCYLMTGHWFQDGASTDGFLWGSVEENAFFYINWKNAVGHGWAMVYVPPWGWLPFDLTAAGYGVDPANTYYESLYASSLPFVTLWQIVVTDYIQERRTEKLDLFTFELHRIEYEEWITLGSIPIADFQYFITNIATLVALIGTLSLFGCVIGIALRRQRKEKPQQ
ncbi:MAG: transglutaminase family protein [Promethearchaeota archaeon]